MSIISIKDQTTYIYHANLTDNYGNNAHFYL